MICHVKSNMTSDNVSFDKAEIRVRVNLIRIYHRFKKPALPSVRNVTHLTCTGLLEYFLGDLSWFFNADFMLSVTTAADPRPALLAGTE